MQLVPSRLPALCPGISEAGPALPFMHMSASASACWTSQILGLCTSYPTPQSRLASDQADAGRPLFEGPLTDSDILGMLLGIRPLPFEEDPTLWVLFSHHQVGHIPVATTCILT